MGHNEIFSRTARRRQNGRAALCDKDSRWLLRLMAEELTARLALLDHAASRCLIIGPGAAEVSEQLAAPMKFRAFADSSWVGAHRNGGVQCDEDRLPFADGSFDLVIAAGGLDSVNDLPGALILLRRTLVAGGLFLGALAGAGCLTRLRGAIASTRRASVAVNRCHPQIDVQAGGDLLARAGFRRSVADMQSVTARYADIYRLISDLRANALGNALTMRAALRRDELADMALAFAPDEMDSKAEESFALLFLTGWAP